LNFNYDSLLDNENASLTFDLLGLSKTVIPFFHFNLFNYYHILHAQKKLTQINLQPYTLQVLTTEHCILKAKGIIVYFTAALTQL